MSYDLSTLNSIAHDFQYDHEDQVRFDEDPYTRISLKRTKDVEVMLVCFRSGQTSSVHDHQGSNCVVKVVRGKVLETLYKEAEDGTLDYQHQHYLREGDISGLDGVQVHQLTNLCPGGTVLLNFYSPPFAMQGFSSESEIDDNV